MIIDPRRGSLSATIEILQRPSCACGYPKPAMKAICANCWRQIPESFRHALYRHHQDGFVDAYDRTVMWLRENSPNFKVLNTYWDGKQMRVCPAKAAPEPEKRA